MLGGIEFINEIYAEYVSSIGDKTAGADAAAPTSTAEIPVASLVGTDDAFVRFHWSALSPGNEGSELIDTVKDFGLQTSDVGVFFSPKS